MKVVFYSSSEKEYQMMSEKLLEEIPDALPYHIVQDGRFCFMDSDLAVVALDGALGMKTVLEYGKHYPGARTVWVSDR